MITSETLIERLCAIAAPSGLEDGAAGFIMSELADICPNAYTDRMGNVIAPMVFGDAEAEDREKIMVCAHMDEVGFMITEVSTDGYLGFDCVGGISEGVLAGRRVKVLTKDGTLCGVIASKAIHHKDKEERQKTVSADKLYIDIGARDRDEAQSLVRVGDFAVYDSETYMFGNGLIKAKALDDRMGCAAMLECMRELCKSPLEGNADVYFCFTVREEIGLSGARVAAFALRPNIAIVLETTAVADISGVSPSRQVARLGCGVAVSLMDRSTVYDRELVELALSVARERGISAQIKKYVSGGNDAGSIHKTAEGVRTLALSVPTRYLHSPACVASMNDYRSQRELLAAVLKKLAESGQINLQRDCLEDVIYKV